jgi:hypothetical protein
MAAASKIVQAAIEILSKKSGGALPKSVRDLPSFKEANRAYKKAAADVEEGRELGEFQYDNDQLDAEDLPNIQTLDQAQEFGDLTLFSDDPGGEALRKWYDGKIDAGDPKFTEAAGFDDEYGERAIDYLKQPSSELSLDPLGYVLKDLEINYGLSKDEIIDYIGKQGALPTTFYKDQFDAESKLIKDLFAAGNPNDPTVKNILDALDDQDSLVELTPELVYGKPN